VIVGALRRGASMRFELEAYRDLDMMLVVMSNYDTIAPSEMAAAIDGILTHR